jgi:hypothetical protein
MPKMQNPGFRVTTAEVSTHSQVTFLQQVRAQCSEVPFSNWSTKTDAKQYARSKARGTEDGTH